MRQNAQAILARSNWSGSLDGRVIVVLCSCLCIGLIYDNRNNLLCTEVYKTIEKLTTTN